MKVQTNISKKVSSPITTIIIVINEVIKVEIPLLLLLSLLVMCISNILAEYSSCYHLLTSSNLEDNFFLEANMTGTQTVVTGNHFLRLLLILQYFLTRHKHGCLITPVGVQKSRRSILLKVEKSMRS